MSEFHREDDTYTGQLDWSLWRRIVNHTRPYRWPIVGMGVAGIVQGIIETFLPIVTGRLVDEAIINGVTSTFWTYGILYFVLMLLICVTIWIFIYLAGQIAPGIAFDLRNKAFEKLQELSFSYFDVRPVGWLVTRLTSDCQKIASLVPWFVLDLAWGICLIVGIAIAMFTINATLAICVLLIVPPLVVVTMFFQRKLLHSARQVRQTNSQLTASFNECITGVRTTRSLVREEANLGEFQEQTQNMYQYAMANALHSAVYLPMVMTLGSVGIGVALWSGGVALGDSISIGSLVAFMQYAGLFSMPIQEMSRRFTDLQAAQAAAERVQSLLDTEAAIQDSDAVRQNIIEQQLEVKPDVAFDGFENNIKTVSFDHVTFCYKPNEVVLDDFCFQANAGQTIALVGATGGGKSTIVNLVARFYEAQQGAVRINGQDIRERSLHWLQSNLGVVLQVPHLFSGSVRENIRYGRLDATDNDVEAAAALVGADTFIRRLENGFDFDVGETGSRLSTGQRQLIALARAILADPQIFIMDEATSSVDTETEQLLQQAIDAVLADRTAFVIAHRLSTIRAADVILVIDNGQINEQGTHKQLLDKKGRYFELYTRQFKAQQEAMALEQPGEDPTPSSQ